MLLVNFILTDFFCKPGFSPKFASAQPIFPAPGSDPFRFRNKKWQKSKRRLGKAMADTLRKPESRG
jgi:hypothetical protein